VEDPAEPAELLEGVEGREGRTTRRQVAGVICSARGPNQTPNANAHVPKFNADMVYEPRRRLTVQTHESRTTKVRPAVEEEGTSQQTPALRGG